MELHWLPVKFRIHFKVALLVFKSLHGLAPPYLSELIHVKSEGRYALRSQDKMLLNVTVHEKTNKKVMTRARVHATAR